MSFNLKGLSQNLADQEWLPVKPVTEAAKPLSLLKESTHSLRSASSESGVESESESDYGSDDDLSSSDIEHKGDDSDTLAQSTNLDHIPFLKIIAPLFKTVSQQNPIGADRYILVQKEFYKPLLDLNIKTRNYLAKPPKDKSSNFRFELYENLEKILIQDDFNIESIEKFVSQSDEHYNLASFLYSQREDLMNLLDIHTTLTIKFKSKCEDKNKSPFMAHYFEEHQKAYGYGNNSLTYSVGKF